MKKYCKKNTVKMSKYSWIIITSLFLMAVSCNSPFTKQKENRNELSEEVQDVEEKLSEVIVTEKTELKSEVDSIVNDFDNKIAKMESNIEKDEEKLNSETEKMLKRLKVKRNTLSKKVDEIETQTEKNWEAFRDELQHDTKQFTSSIKDFFKDNA